MGAQQINNSRTLCYSFQPHANPDLRSTEPTQITPFLGNFPDPTLSLPTRTGNALILGIVTVTRELPKSMGKPRVFNRISDRRPSSMGFHIADIAGIHASSA